MAFLAKLYCCILLNSVFAWPYFPTRSTTFPLLFNCTVSSPPLSVEEAKSCRVTNTTHSCVLQWLRAANLTSFGGFDQSSLTAINTGVIHKMCRRKGFQQDFFTCFPTTTQWHKQNGSWAAWPVMQTHRTSQWKANLHLSSHAEPLRLEANNLDMSVPGV